MGNDEVDRLQLLQTERMATRGTHSDRGDGEGGIAGIGGGGRQLKRKETQGRKEGMQRRVSEEANGRSGLEARGM